ncbi:hypothetical protein HDIA_2433 [Hartmannibacter diazotrophicus]|uniref:Uncharacterized protein n=1 Tax=Hartmannibacter diazotrophicus TaxID=1482074 RepID=A0A2C9D6M1_9HYPH|nr:hypothetical protein [Hartmannibacter diazotrophicus]SON55974.1 hypothetical protein HDIA_2433 [Hartmannibacter diazotrophicus]
MGIFELSHIEKVAVVSAGIATSMAAIVACVLYIFQIRSDLDRAKEDLASMRMEVTELIKNPTAGLAGPPGPKGDPGVPDNSAIEALSKRVATTEATLGSVLSSMNSLGLAPEKAKNATSSAGNATSGENATNVSLLGEWVGNVVCKSGRRWSVSLMIDKQAADLGKGTWTYSGTSKGNVPASLGLTSTIPGSPPKYALITDSGSVYDYDLIYDSPRFTGTSSRDDCSIVLQK